MVWILNRWRGFVLGALLGAGVAVPIAGVGAEIRSAPIPKNLSRSTDQKTGPSHILLRRGVIDTDKGGALDTSGRDLERSGLQSANSFGRELRIVQFAGPIKQSWVRALRATGAETVGYVPNNAYIVRGSASELARVASLHNRQGPNDVHPIKWIGSFEAVYKIDPVFTNARLSDSEESAVEIELIDSPLVGSSIEAIRRRSLGDFQTRRFGNFVIVGCRISLTRLLDIAESDDVLYIGPAPALRLLDEVSLQILAGNLIPDQTRPAGPGYTSWLNSLGLTFTPDFVVDVTDSGLDRGSTLPTEIHQDLLDAQGSSRVEYSVNYADDGLVDDRPGHGSLMTSIVAGWAPNGLEDSSGFKYGHGVDPTARVGASRIFDQFGAPPFRLSLSAVVKEAYLRNARVSNNSWGRRGPGYDSFAQEYDILARDANADEPGNQEMTFVFAAGNDGPGGTINSPGIAKNVIAVAASESYRPASFDSCNLDGQGPIGPDGADNALDLLRFSSGGPADGRAKPDVTAPGTHVHGGASRSNRFFGQGLCPGIPVFQPPGQRDYTWSSGTSLAAAHVTGAAALVRKFFTSRNLLGGSAPPSPAMIKAFLINSTSYITGQFAGGDLPSPRQGWGLINLSHAFDSARRILVDQTELITESGQTFELRGSLADRSRPLRVTLTWTDAPGSLAGPALVNDLDLELRIGEEVVYRANSFSADSSMPGGEPDRLNNVESLTIPASAFPSGFSGNFTISIRAANIAGDGVPGNGLDLDQDFALVVSNVAPPLPGEPGNEIPVVSDASYVKKRLTIIGSDFSAGSQVEINGKIIDRAFAFDPSSNSLSIKLKMKKLNLRIGTTNQIVVIENGERSQPFSLLL